MGKKQKQTTKTTPYSGKYAGWVDEVKNQLWDANSTPAEGYTGQLTTGLSDTQQSAMSGLSSLIGTSALTDTIGGKYLDPETNPYLSQYYDQAESKIMKSLGTANDNVNSQFNTRGLYNSSARKESLQDQADQAGETLANVATNLYGNAYTTERANQMNAINQQGSLINSQFTQGTTEQGLNQTALDAQYKEWLRQQGVDDADMDNVMSLLSLVKNPTQTTTSSGGTGLLGGVASGFASGWGSSFGKS